MSEKTRTVRSTESKVAEIDAKIQAHKNNISALEAKKFAILNPAPRKSRLSAKSIIDAAKEAGMTPEQIAEKLGIKL